MVFLTPFDAGDGGGVALEELVDESEMVFKRHDDGDADGGMEMGEILRRGAGGKILEVQAHATHIRIYGIPPDTGRKFTTNLGSNLRKPSDEQKKCARQNPQNRCQRVLNLK
jgi:hypothetical protein